MSNDKLRRAHDALRKIVVHFPLEHLIPGLLPDRKSGTPADAERNAVYRQELHGIHEAILNRTSATAASQLAEEEVRQLERISERASDLKSISRDLNSIGRLPVRDSDLATATGISAPLISKLRNRLLWPENCSLEKARWVAQKLHECLPRVREIVHRAALADQEDRQSILDLILQRFRLRLQDGDQGTNPDNPLGGGSAASAEEACLAYLRWQLLGATKSPPPQTPDHALLFRTNDPLDRTIIIILPPHREGGIRQQIRDRRVIDHELRDLQRRNSAETERLERELGANAVPIDRGDIA